MYNAQFTESVILTKEKHEQFLLLAVGTVGLFGLVFFPFVVTHIIPGGIVFLPEAAAFSIMFLFRFQEASGDDPQPGFGHLQFHCQQRPRGQTPQLRSEVDV